MICFVLTGSFFALGGGEISALLTPLELIADSIPAGMDMSRVRQMNGMTAVRFMVKWDIRSVSSWNKPLIIESDI